MRRDPLRQGPVHVHGEQLARRLTARGPAHQQSPSPRVVAHAARPVGDELPLRPEWLLGLRLARKGSLSGLCVQTGDILRCEDSEIDPRVDREACRRVGLRSMVVTPLKHLDTFPQEFD